MNIYLAFTLFSVVILIYWIITGLFAMLFRFTGLPDEKARFQVISLLTGCGFTTRESEMLLSTKSRRNLARITMLFGYVFNITILSAFVNVFFSFNLTELSNYFSILIPLFALAVILVFMRVPVIRSWGDRTIEKIAGRIVHHDAVNTALLLDYIGEDSITQVTLHVVPESLAGKKLSETRLKADHNLLVMLIERNKQKAEPPTADTVFQPEDKLTVFGKHAVICSVFQANEHFDD